jgi:[acyl-carrier-protein] S-malonyltransferase
MQKRRALQSGGEMPGYAVIFPGQGSQYVRMGQDLYAASAAARAVLDEADEACQGRLKGLLLDGPPEELTDTANAQPALFAVSMACWAAFREALAGQAELQPAFVAGHSLGEYSALAAAGAFSFGAGMALVQERGRAMKAAGEARPGRMAAVLGLDAQAVARACDQAAAQTGEVVVVANDNAPGQIVISGTLEGVQAASEAARGLGARRVIPLAVSIASHSSLMEVARARFAQVLRQVDLRPPHLPVIGNRQARPLDSSEAVIAELEQQLVSPVRWTASIEYMVGQGISTFIEMGPKDVLTGLLRRIAPTAMGVPCGTVAGVQQAAELVREPAG